MSIKLERNDFWGDNSHPYDTYNNRSILQNFGIRWESIKELLDTVGMSTNSSHRRLLFCSTVLYTLVIAFNIGFFIWYYHTLDQEDYPVRNIEECMIIFYVFVGLIVIYGIVLTFYYNLKAIDAMKSQAQNLLEEQNKSQNVFHYELTPTLELVITKRGESVSTSKETLLNVNSNELHVVKILHLPVNNNIFSSYEIRSPIVLEAEPRLRLAVTQIYDIFNQVSGESVQRKMILLIFSWMVLFGLATLLLFSLGGEIYLSRPGEILVEIVICLMSVEFVLLLEHFSKRQSEESYRKINNLNTNLLAEGLFIDCRFRTFSVSVVVLNRGVTQQELLANSLINKYLE